MKKRIFSVILSIFLLMITIIPVSAEETLPKDESKTLITEEIIINMAENFAKEINPLENISAANPIKLYDMNGQAIGYVVNYYKDDMPYGYIIFDNSNSDLISEYSFGEASLNPYSTIVQKNNVSTYSTEEPFLYKTAPFTYALYDASSEKLIDNYGYSQNVDVSTFSNKPAEWEDVIFDTSEINSSYSIISTNHLDDFYAFGETYIEDLTGHYACLVSALYTCGSFFGVLDYSDVKGDYLQLWEDTKTEFDHEDNGITYGSTNIFDGASGFEKFCRRKGKNISTYTTDTVTYNFFTTAIDKGKISVVHAGIFSASDQERSGHSMAVEGYASLSEKNSGKDVDMLMIFDGWNEYIRYLNFDFNGWMDLRGTNFE